MYKLKLIAIVFYAITLMTGCHNSQSNSPHITEIEQAFLHIPDSIQTSVYWYWMSDNISKEGVIKDLKAMKSVGINRAFIGNIGYPTTPYGEVKLFSDEWWDVLHTALKTATELNIQIGLFNGPGWSQSGGPWIKPNQSMRYLDATELTVQGPIQLNQLLQKPDSNFQDVRVIAYKNNPDIARQKEMAKPSLDASAAVENENAIIDQDSLTVATLSDVDSIALDFSYQVPVTIRSLEIFPARKKQEADVLLQVKANDGFRTLKQFHINRTNDQLNVGFKPFAPIAISIDATTGNSFRLVFKKRSPSFGIADIKLSPEPIVERYIEKTLAKMYQTPLPYWKEYQWPMQPVIKDSNLVIQPDNIIDITKNMTAAGKINWSVPEGKWTILRLGMRPTGVTNGPASPEGTGLEVDKMSKEHVAAHFDAFLGEVMRRIPAADRKSLKVAVEDSYETGGQNWTDGMIPKFKKAFGYDPVPYLPTLQGKVVGSEDQSDRFLWDLRRFIADRVAYDYVGGLREVSHKHGLTTWLENYGHWGFPGEFLQYGGQSDEIGGEFWSEGELGNIENRAASSAAHIYGKTKVSAESFTAGGGAYTRYPYLFKQRGDRFFTEGINNTLLHVFIEQPDERLPGINANFSSEFNRHNTWFGYMDLFVPYLKRCNYMLQQGKYVAQVAYFIGEDAPKMTGITDPPLPKGYSYDYINAEVIENRLKVKDGKLVLPDGMSYDLLVLPPLETMRPELMKKIQSLVNEGANILGPAPSRSPSLANYPAADKELKTMAATLWGDIDGHTIKSHTYGKGHVYSNMELQPLLESLKIQPDFNVLQDSVLYIHRKTADADIYFISNQREQDVNIQPTFNIEDKIPEVWDPVNATVRKLPVFSKTDNGIQVPIKMAAYQSFFIIFKNGESSAASGQNNSNRQNFPEPNLVEKIEGPWNVQFDTSMRGPAGSVVFQKLMDWTKHSNPDIKYYAGTAIYHHDFDLAALPKKGTKLYLNLGDVKNMAKININGKAVGGVWTAPWRVDITDAVKSGKNSIEIAVVNTWVNRLIGDAGLPENQRKTWTSDNPYNAKSPLQASGLKGPVNITAINYDGQ